MRLFGSWLDETQRLQLEAYHHDLQAFVGDDRADAVMMNILAATDELHEALQEVDWKPWLTVGRGAWHDRDAFVGELVDVLHFVANLLVLAGCDDLELSRRYAAKMSLNRRRQTDGYDGRSTKCSGCGRALDDDTTLCTAERCVY